MSTFKIDLSDLLNGLGEDAELTEAAVADVRKKLALDLLGGLQMATPVDTGEARNSWQIETTTDQSVVHTSSPYMNKLNLGHSKQAPAGFIENVIDAVTKR
ncbi:HK97 gp10 family phage protein [Brevundimonas sp.]|uniref:HK97 gp10 family phage protein n=1 Tax=Brevundimonas sp. TaxID=1871086 RepID=UPI0035AFBE84